MSPQPPSPPSRREWLLVAGLTLVAAVLRFRAFGALGLTHFDEGVYALAGLWSVAPGGLDPQVIAYAPPGFPILVGLAYAVLGVADTSALLVPIVLGVLTVPAVAWVARRTFGPGAGAAGAAFSALSMAHVSFSRKALTDAPFLLAWVVAAGLGGRFLERPALGRAVALGLAVGAAQNLKYNGWLVLVVVAVAAMFGLVADAESRRPTAMARTLGFGLVAAAVAGLCYVPWYLFVERHGGYAALLAHQRSYLGGPGTWVPYWKTQSPAQAVALSGGWEWGAATFAAAWVACGLAVHGPRLIPRGSRPDARRFRVGLLIGAAALATIADLPWWVGLGWSGWLLADRLAARRLLGSWWVVLTVMTPFYHPYARLWLPLHAAGWVLMAGLVVRLGPFNEAPGDGAMRRRVRFQVATAAVCLLVVRWHWAGHPPHPFPVRVMSQRTDTLRTAVAHCVNRPELGSNPEARLRVLGRRPVAFYLALRGTPFRLLPDESEIASGPGRSGEWALADEAQLGHRLGPPLDRNWQGVANGGVRLDPVTLLDVDPGVAFRIDPPRDMPYLILLRPR